MVSEETSDPLVGLARVFEKLGSEPQAARVMAGQLLKRARQIAVARGVSEPDALASLLEKVIQGRRGEYGPREDGPGKTGA